MRNWNIGGIIATLIIVLSLPLYALKEKKMKNQTRENPDSKICHQ
jgi:hypothetical protein